MKKSNKVCGIGLILFVFVSCGDDKSNIFNEIPFECGNLCDLACRKEQICKLNPNRAVDYGGTLSECSENCRIIIRQVDIDGYDVVTICDRSIRSIPIACSEYFGMTDVIADNLQYGESK